MCADDRQAFGFVKVVVESHEEQWEDAVARRQILGVTRQRHRRAKNTRRRQFKIFILTLQNLQTSQTAHSQRSPTHAFTPQRIRSRKHVRLG